MEKLFVTHHQLQNQIPFLHSVFSLAIILPFLFLLIVITLERKEGMAKEEFFTSDAVLMLRGIAIIFLIIGHLALKCLEGILPFEFAGQWAVIIFLTISGIGLAKRYQLKDCGKSFLRRRLERLIFPVWITLTLFYFLDLFLRGASYPFSKIVLSYLGIISPGPPNGPAWFISYIIFLYIMYYFIALLKAKFQLKVAVITTISFGFGLLSENVSFLRTYFAIWTDYALAFPIGVVVGMYHQRLFSYSTYLFIRSKIIYFGSVVLLWVLYLKDSMPSGIIERGAYGDSRIPALLNPIFLILGTIMLGVLFDLIRIRSRFLLILGKYSFEIYLLHLPFMEYYDFLLFRGPLFIYFFIYFLFILFIAFLLKSGASRLNGLIFVKG